jgi:hypothetical protein
MRYYIEFGGGLGDIFYQMYSSGKYSSLQNLENADTAVIALITHNPFASELFQFHPQKARFEVRSPGYWLPEHDATNRRIHGLPPFAPAQFDPGPAPCHGPVTFYPSADDVDLIARILEEARSRGAPIIVFAVSAGEPFKDIPVELVPRLVAAVRGAGALPVFVGRRYERNGRRELMGACLSGGIDTIDRLTVPGTAMLVQQAAGVVCCHSSINMLAWMERKPQLLLYPASIFENFIRPRTLWALGVDYPETVHGLADHYGDSMMDRFLRSVESSLGASADRALKVRPDVREFLRLLPHTTNPHNGEDYTKADWFMADAAYPFYVRAAEAVRPKSILEIGTLLGFGLAAFIKGYPLVRKVVSVDNEAYIPGSQALCRANLSFYAGEKVFANSLQELRGCYDFIHVDGDHSFAGALCDIAFAWGLGPRVMLVDDYLFLGDVRRAVETFAAHQGLPYRVWKSFRGWAVFARPDVLPKLPYDL